jgi:2-oxoglutarate ferredoxin oxidoreductase subunit beta
MTGGQMAPTTLIGQKTTTCPLGRDQGTGRHAHPHGGNALHAGRLRLCRARLRHRHPAPEQGKAAIKKAFQKQLAGEGFTFVEVLSTCPTNWGMTALKSKEWLEENMIPYYPLGCIKDIDAKAEVK